MALLIAALVVVVATVATVAAAAAAEAVDNTDEDDGGTSPGAIILGIIVGVAVGLVVGAVVGAVAAVLLLPLGIVLAVGAVILGAVIGGIAAANKDLINSLGPSFFRSPNGGSKDETANWWPHFHFTPKSGWISDPCGLAVFGSKRHLFFQHIPTALGREPISFFQNLTNLKWGHANTSDEDTQRPDVVSWNELEPELQFDAELGSPFTGCAVTHLSDTAPFDDPDLEEHGGKRMVLVFTRSKLGFLWIPRQGQTLAFKRNSTGLPGERQFTLFGQLVTDTKIQFRDPKLVRVAAREGFDDLQWLMAVAADDCVEFHLSSNLTEWKLIGQFQVYDNAERFVECPELRRVPIENSTEQRWVLWLSRGAFPGTSRTAVQYYVGNVGPTGFIPTQGRKRLDRGPDFYAMQSWFAEPDGRAVAIGWMSNWQYAEFVPTSPWKGHLSIPRILNLRGSDEEFILIQQPHPDIETLREGNPFWLDNFPLPPGERIDVVEAAPADVHIQIDGTAAGTFTLDLQHGGESTAQLIWNSPTLTLARTGGETSFHDQFADTFAGDIASPGDSLDLRLFIDSSSIEIFAAGGELVFSALIFPRVEPAILELTNTGNSPLTLTAELYSMRRA